MYKIVPQLWSFKIKLKFYMLVKAQTKKVPSSIRETWVKSTRFFYSKISSIFNFDLKKL